MTSGLSLKKTIEATLSAKTVVAGKVMRYLAVQLLVNLMERPLQAFLLALA
jgi:hypothetical protein